MDAQTFQNSGCGQVSSTLLNENRYIRIVNTGRIERLINTDIRIVGVLVSLLVSCFTILNRGLPNDDAYSYIRIAEIALNGD